jgi:F0F1-type ATP synthase assembly protein I
MSGAVPANQFAGRKAAAICRTPKRAAPAPGRAVADQQTIQSSVWRQVAAFSGLGFVLFCSIGGGYLLGWLLDRKLGTTPLFAMILAGFGLAGGLIKIVQYINRVDKREGVDGDGSGKN